MVILTFLIDALSHLFLDLHPHIGLIAKWLVLFIALLALLDLLYSALLVILRGRPLTLPKEKQTCLRVVKDRESSDLQAALEKFQNDFIAAQLRCITVRESEIPNIGLLVKHRLASQGINNAYEVRPDRLLSMKWLGEVPRHALLRWRAEKEDEARASVPCKLPEEQIAQIHARYEALRRKIVEEGI